MDGEITQGEEITNKLRWSVRNTNKPNRYGSIPYTKNFWIELINKDCYGSNVERGERHLSAGKDTEARRFHAKRHDTTRNLQHVESSRDR